MNTQPNNLDDSLRSDRSLQQHEMIPRRSFGFMLAASLLLTATESAQANENDGARSQPDSRRIEIFTARDQRRMDRADGGRPNPVTDRRPLSPSGGSSGGAFRIPESRKELRTGAIDNNPQMTLQSANASEKKAKSTRNTGRGSQREPKVKHPRKDTQVGADGLPVVLSHGFLMDLMSSTTSVTLGDKLLATVGSVEILVGGVLKELVAGSKVTPAEYVAVKQLLGSGKQSILLDKSGRAIGGVLDLSDLAGAKGKTKIDELLIADGITAYSDCARNALVKLKGDVNNYGDLIFYSSKDSGKTGQISAENVTNQPGALIGTAEGAGLSLDLVIDAAQKFENFGTVLSSGNLLVTAGDSLTNGNGAKLSGIKDVDLTSPVLNNKGLVSALTGAVNLNSPTDLLVNNSGGVVQALNGDINVRDKSFHDVLNTSIIGGILGAKDINLNSGGGLTNVDVDDLVGTVNSFGEAVHILSRGSDLVLGEQCLVGDPTYFNAGNIALTGNINVGEKLAILAGGNITSTAGVTQIVARTAANKGEDIAIVAGAMLTPSVGAPSTGSIPPGTPIGAADSVRVTGASLTGGSIDFSASSGLQIQADSTSGNQAGGNVSLLAFENLLGAGGDVRLASNSVVNTSGSGTAANGSILAAGRGAITLGSLLCDGGTQTVGGAITVNTVQPDFNGGTGGGVQFSSTGAIVNGGSFSATTLPDMLGNTSLTVGNGTGQQISTHGDVTLMSGGDVTVNLGTTGGIKTNGGDTVISSLGSINVTAGAGIDTRAVGGGGDVTMTAGTILGLAGVNAAGVNVNTSAITSGGAGDVSVTSGGLLGSTVAVGNVTANGAGGGVGGDVSVTAGDSVTVGAITSTGAQGGQVDVHTGPVIGNLNLLGDITAGQVLLDCPLLATITTPLAGIIVTADGFDFTGLLNAGSGTVCLRPLTDGTPIDIGGVGGLLNLDLLELGNIQCGVLQIGDRLLGGGLTVSGLLNLSLGGPGSYDLDLRNLGDVLVSAPTVNLGARNLTIDAGGLVTTSLLLSTAGDISVDAGAGINLGPVTAPLSDLNLVSNTGAINLNALVTTNSLTAHGPVVNVLNAVNCVGSVDLVTDVLHNVGPITGNAINIQSLTSGLLLDSTGALTGTLSALTINVTALTGNLAFLGDHVFNGVTNLVAALPTQSLIVNLGSIVTGLNLLNVTTPLINLQGILQGSPLVINTNGAGTIANSQGDVNLTGNMIFHGKDLAIIASGSINAGTATLIDLSDASNGGNFVALAGYNFTPGTSGQVGPITDRITVSGPSTGGGSINFGALTIDTSSDTGTAGKVTLVANGGSTNTGIVTVNNIDASGGAAANGNDVVIIGEGGVNIPGWIQTHGTPVSGNVLMAVAQPVINGGSLVIENGTLSGATIGVGSATAGNITTHIIDAGNGDVSMLGALNAGNTIAAGSSIVADVLDVTTGAGTANFANTEANAIRTAGGGQVTVNEADGVTLLSQGTNSLTVNAGQSGTGDLTTSADFSLANLNLHNDGGDIVINNAVSATSSAVLNASGNVLSPGGSLTSPDVSLVSGGSIGTNANSGRFNVNTTKLTLVQAGTDAFVNNTNSGPLTIVSGHAAGTLDVLTVGNLVSSADFNGANLAFRSAGLLDLSGDLNGTQSILLQSGPNLTNSQVSGAVTTPILTLISMNGNVGVDSNNRFLAQSGVQQVAAQAMNGSIFLDGAQGFNLGTCSAKDLIDILAHGPMTVGGNVTTANGSIKIETTQGLLQTGTGVVVTANEGNIDMIVSDTNKRNKRSSRIVFGAGSTVQALASAAGLGNLNIRVGAVQPAKEGPTPRKNVTVTTSGGGQIFWGSKGRIKFNAPNNSLTAKGANITFTKINSKSIQFKGGVTLIADPPVADSIATSTDAAKSTQALTNSDLPSSAGAQPQSILRDNLVTSTHSDQRPQANILSSMLSRTALPTDLVGVPCLDCTASGVMTATGTAEGAATAQISNDLAEDDSYIEGTASPTMQIDSTICGATARAWAPTSAIADEQKCMLLSRGRTLFTPERDMEVVTPFGKLAIDADSVVLVSLSSNGLAIYNLHDESKKSVRFTSANHTIALAPSQHITLSTHQHREFGHANHIPSISHKSLTTHCLSNGYKLYQSQFSITSAFDGVRPVSELLKSENSEAVKLSRRLLKTCVVVETLARSQEPYRYFYKPVLAVVAKN